MDTRRRGCHGVMGAIIKSAPHLMTTVKGGMGQGLRLFEGVVTDMRVHGALTS